MIRKIKGDLITVNHDIDLWEKSYEEDSLCKPVTCITKGSIGVILDNFEHECLVFFSQGKGWVSHSNLFRISSV